VSAALVTSRLALALALAAGCSVSGEIPDIEVVQHDIVIPAVPAEGRVGEPTVSLPNFIEPHDHLALDRNSYSSVKVREVQITAKSGVNDLSFIRELRVSMNGVQGYFAGTTPVEIGHYTRGAERVGATLLLKPDPPAEVVVPWRDPLSVVLIEVKGTLPDEKWTIDVTVRLSAQLKY
jgi:hypothetical protein